MNDAAVKEKKLERVPGKRNVMDGKYNFTSIWLVYCY